MPGSADQKTGQVSRNRSDQFLRKLSLVFSAVLGLSTADLVWVPFFYSFNPEAEVQFWIPIPLLFSLIFLSFLGILLIERRVQDPWLY